jgi:polar amino acid transport system substrate-binding protein
MTGRYFFSIFTGLLALSSFSLSINVYAEEMPLGLVAGLAKPPFIIEENGQGMQLEIIREAFESMNKEVSFIHVPYGRVITEFKQLNTDGIITLPSDYEHPSLHMSKPYITYQNVAVSLLESNFSINEIQDLSDKSIISFQNARKYLGDEYNLVANYSMDYRERADQTQQIDMLFARRTEVIILDINIFKYLLANRNEGQFNQPFNVHYLFNERLYSAGFKSKEVRDLFDQGIVNIKEQGTYQSLLDKYLDFLTLD